MRKAKWGAALFLGALLLTVLVQNADPVELEFLLWETALPRPVLLLGTFAAGTLVGALFRGVPARRA